MIKKAFSMIEVMIVLTVIGFIIIAELCIINQKANEYGQSYYATYNALKKANYNVLADIYCPDVNSTNAACRLGPRSYPTEPRELCSRLTEFINVSENNCSSTNFTVINDNANNINTNNPAFIASNSFRFYIGNERTYVVTDVNGRRDELRYFVVYVDINGEKRPNRLRCDDSDVLPDIVPFALTRRGEVIPMGLPVYSNAYMTAKIKYPGTINEDSNEMENKSASSMSYYEATFGAWPNGNNSEVQENYDIPFSIMLSEDRIYQNSSIRQCYNGTIARMKTEKQYKEEAITKATRENTNHIHRTRGCIGGTFNCRVVIDSSINTRW